MSGRLGQKSPRCACRIRAMSAKQDIEPSLLAAFRAAILREIERGIVREQMQAEELRARLLPAITRGLAKARADGLCRRAWLFGSFAWGLPTARSDVDLLVESAPDTMLIAAMVGEECAVDVHVVALEDAPESLREHAFAEGRQL